MRVVAVAFALVLATPLFAHHSAAAIYATDQSVTVKGIVTSFSLGNPHMRIYFTRTDQEDRKTEWVAEGGSRTVLTRRGWTQDTVKPGDAVALLANPSRDGRYFVHVTEITLADGRKLAAEDLVPTAPALRKPAATQDPGAASP
jgi:Family of unknown function (DUF6152)